MNINFYLYVYQHIISINIFHQQKKYLLPKTKKICAPIISPIIQAQTILFFPFTYQHRPPQLHLGSSCFLISVI